MFNFVERKRIDEAKSVLNANKAVDEKKVDGES